MTRRIDPDKARRMGGMIADYKPEAITREVEVYGVRLVRDAKTGAASLHQSPVSRKVRMSLPRVKWLEDRP